jgi:hypothetical protein
MITGNFFSDTGKTFGKAVVQIRGEVFGFVQVLVDQVTGIPIITNFKEQCKQVSNHCILFVSK